jgi:hypothetical protein
MSHGTRCITNSQSVVLEWSQRQFIKTIHLDPEGNNVGTMWSAPGITIANQVIEYMHCKFPNSCFSSETIEIINPDPYDTNTDEDGIQIETSDDISDRIVAIKDPRRNSPESTNGKLTPPIDPSNEIEIFMKILRQKIKYKYTTTPKAISRRERTTTNVSCYIGTSA